MTAREYDLFLRYASVTDPWKKACLEKKGFHTFRKLTLHHPPKTHHTYLLPRPHSATFVSAQFQHPASPFEVLLVFPEWSHAGAEEMDAVPWPNGLPGEVVEDAVEGCYVGD